MNSYLLGLLILFNAASAALLFLGYRELKQLKSAVAKSKDPTANQLAELVQQLVQQIIAMTAPCWSQPDGIRAVRGFHPNTSSVTVTLGSENQKC